MLTTKMDSEKIKMLFEICRNSESINAASGIWVNIAHVREMMTILNNDAPELVELSFIESWLSSLDIFLHKIAFIMQIQKPKRLELKNWCYPSFNPPKICSMMNHLRHIMNNRTHFFLPKPLCVQPLPSQATTQYWIIDRNGELILKRNLHDAIKNSNSGLYALCDYGISSDGYESHKGNVWHIDSDVMSLICSFTKTNIVNIEMLEKFFHEECNFTYWKILPVSKEFYNSFMEYKNNNELYMPSYLIKDNNIFFDASVPDANILEDFLEALEKQQFDQADRLMDKL